MTRLIGYVLLFVVFVVPIALGIAARSAWFLFFWLILLLIGGRQWTRLVGAIVIALEQKRLSRSLREQHRLLSWSDFRAKAEQGDGLLLVNYMCLDHSKDAPGMFWWTCDSGSQNPIHDPNAYLACLPFRYFWRPQRLRRDFPALRIVFIPVPSRTALVA